MRIKLSVKLVTVALMGVSASVPAVAAGLTSAPSDAGTVTVAPLVIHRDSVVPAASKAQITASARIDTCTKSSVIAERAMTIRADMFRVAGSASMRVRFRALRTLQGQAESELLINTGEKLGYWENPVPASSGAVSHLVFYKRLYSLDAPASFRAEVNFEWYAAGNRLLKSQTVKLGSCVQPDLRPDLVVDRVTVAAIPGRSDALRYRVTVSNQGNGRSAAAKLNVRVPIGESLRTFTPASVAGKELLVGRIDQVGTTRKPTRVDPLVMTRTVLVDAAKCSSGNATIEIDPGNLLDESNSANNSYSVGVDCSKPTPAG